MPTIQIRNLSDDVYGKLKQMAKRDRRSIQQEAAWLLEQALNQPKKEDRRELWRITDSIQEAMREKYGELPDSTPDMREARDER
jgi:plasmid stability protein